MIRKYNDSDFLDVRNITYNYWSNEVEMDLSLKSFIYTFLVKYYLSNYDYSYVSIDDNLNAFLLASLKNDSNNSINYFNDEINKLDNKNKTLALEYLEYLDYLEYNHNKVLSYMNNNDIYLALIASIKHHKGFELIEELIKAGRNNNNEYLYLWTDETCNYGYYSNIGFEKVEEYIVTLYNITLKTFIYRFKL